MSIVNQINENAREKLSPAAVERLIVLEMFMASLGQIRDAEAAGGKQPDLEAKYRELHENSEKLNHDLMIADRRMERVMVACAKRGLEVRFDQAKPAEDQVADFITGLHQFYAAVRLMLSAAGDDPGELPGAIVAAPLAVEKFIGGWRAEAEARAELKRARSSLRVPVAGDRVRMLKAGEAKCFDLTGARMIKCEAGSELEVVCMIQIAKDGAPPFDADAYEKDPVGFSRIAYVPAISVRIKDSEGNMATAQVPVDCVELVVPA